MDENLTEIGIDIGKLLRTTYGTNDLRRNTLISSSKIGTPRGFDEKLTDILLSDSNALEYVSSTENNQLLNCMFFLVVHKNKHAMLVVKTTGVMEAHRVLINSTDRHTKSGFILKPEDNCLIYDLRIDEESSEFFINKQKRSWGLLSSNLVKVRYFMTLVGLPERFLDWIILTSSPSNYSFLLFDCVEFVKNVGTKLLRLETSQLSKSYGLNQLCDFTITDTFLEASSRRELTAAKTGNFFHSNLFLIPMVIILVVPIYVKLFFQKK